MKTNELIDLALDRVVAECEGGEGGYYRQIPYYQPSTDWSQGGPIIEREGIALEHMPFAKEWEARLYPTDGTPWVLTGPTPLIAAMRCYVASRLGDDVEIPNELQGE